MLPTNGEMKRELTTTKMINTISSGGLSTIPKEELRFVPITSMSSATSSSKSSNITLGTYKNNNNNTAIKSKLMPINVVPPLTIKATPGAVANATATVGHSPTPPLIQLVTTNKGVGSAGNVSNSNLLAILTPSGKTTIISASSAKGNAQPMLIRSTAASSSVASQPQSPHQQQINGNPGQSTKTTSTLTTVSAPVSALVGGSSSSVPAKATSNTLVPSGQISLLANSRAPVILSKAAVDKLRMKFNQAKANPSAILLSNNKNHNNNNNNNKIPPKIKPMPPVKTMSKPDPTPDTVPAATTAPPVTPTQTVAPTQTVTPSQAVPPTQSATSVLDVAPGPTAATAPSITALPSLTLMKVQKATIAPLVKQRDLPTLGPAVIGVKKVPHKLQRSKSFAATEQSSPGSERRHSVAIMAKEVDVIEQPRTIETITIDDDDDDDFDDSDQEDKQATKPQKPIINKPTVTVTTKTKTPTCTPTPTPISSRKNSSTSASTLSSISSSRRSSSSDVEEIHAEQSEKKFKKEEPTAAIPSISILKAETLNLSNEDFERSLRCDEQVSPSSSSSSSASIKPKQKNSVTSSSPPGSSSGPTLSVNETQAANRPNTSSGGRPSLILNNLKRSVLQTLPMVRWRGQQPGQLPNSTLRFELNRLNLLQLNERCEPRQGPANYFERSLFDRPDRRPTATADPLLYLCQRCNCHGPAADFLAPRYCSLACVRRGQKRRLPPGGSNNNNSQVEAKMSRLSAGATGSSASSASTSAASTLVSEAVVKVASTEARKVVHPKEKVKKQFRWSEYLAKKGNDIAAPIHLFFNPFPINPNGFQRGMKVEAIDPENCSLFCVCTIAEVRGYRLKLHFDGYASMYDFYVNADSMDIFPPGWCYSTGRVLQAPKGYCSDRFSWSRYLIKVDGKPAPRHLFSHLNMSPQPSMTNGFTVGMHLEAEDLNDTGKICVATVADILDERIRVHFDGWDDCYDLWVHINSPYIHPCGWHDGRQQLIVPPDYQNVVFSWSEYIKDSGGIAAPSHLFKPRLPMEFQSRMKLEVVDQRNPCLIRPATVVNRKGYRVQLHLDCWPTEYYFWLEDDSPDLHPIGWCEATSHELETPPGFLQNKSQMPCDVEGCRGFGNAKRFNLNVHALRDCCPYAPENWRLWRSKTVKPARVSPENIKRSPNKKSSKPVKAAPSSPPPPPAPPITIKTEPKTKSQPEATKPKKMSGKAEKPLDVRSMAIAKTIVNEYGPQFQRNYRLWQKNCDFDLDKINSNPLYWTKWDVYEYVERALNSKVIANNMFDEDIDGRALLMLGRNDLSEHLKLKVGAAVKLFSLIVNLRIAVVCKFETTSTGLSERNVSKAKFEMPKQEPAEDEDVKSTQECERQTNGMANVCDQDELSTSVNDDDDEDVVLDNEDFLNVQPSSSVSANHNNNNNNDSDDVLMAPMKIRMPLAATASS
ncbi:uncharacterized protein Dwil_GK22590 [Drosophila willistoni]|uniref:PNT domain-containing protein n=1 Tax=Drosophila willistoni TaxID=7260 RepID=B4NF73_DROWI|nr:uncharacterized protein Dwil_GK22590 [Drosophila willistoni]